MIKASETSCSISMLYLQANLTAVFLPLEALMWHLAQSSQFFSPFVRQLLTSN